MSRLRANLTGNDRACVDDHFLAFVSLNLCGDSQLKPIAHCTSRYARLDGSTNRVQRMIDISQFQKPDSPLFIYILNTRAGGLGVNLQTADTCILYDSDW